MKSVILFTIAALLSIDPGKISKINSAKEEARKAYTSGDYATAIKKYKYLVDSLNVGEDEVKLNLANAYYLAKDTANAVSNYQSLTSSASKQISSRAHQQMGVMLNQQGKAEEALDQFKQAVKADPSNEQARYNYEMLKKKLEEKKKQDQQQQNKDQQNQDQKNKDQQNKDQQNKDQQNKDQQNKDQQNKDQKNKEDKEKENKDQQNKDEKNKDSKEQKDKEQKEKEQQEQDQEKQDKEQKAPNLDRNKLEQMKISEDKARMILEAMKNQEKQYLQQQKRKATKPRESGKPDW